MLKFGHLSSIIIIFTCFVTVNYMLHSTLLNIFLSHISDTHRRLGNYIPPASLRDEATDYSVALKAIPETSTKSIVGDIISKLKATYSSFTGNVLESEKLAGAVHEFEKSSGGWDSTKGSYHSYPFSKDIESLINSRYKSETPSWRDLVQEGTRYEDMVEIIISTDNSTSASDWLSFLDDWRFAIERIGLIIIQLGNTTFHVEMPTWAEYIIFNEDDLKKSMEGSEWIYLESKAAARSFGALVAERDYLFYLDTSMSPAIDPNTGELVNPLEEHLLNILTPSTPYYFNTLHDAFRKGSDFPRGYPYSLREGVPTAMSQGRVVNESPYDSLTALVKRNELQTAKHSHAQTIPHGALFSLNTQSLMVYRPITGPCMYFPAPSALPGLDIGDKNRELLTGWICKLTIERVKGGVKFGGNTIVNATHGREFGRLNVDEQNKVMFAEMKQDLVWGSCCQEQTVRYFNDLVLSSNKDIASHAVGQIADGLIEKLSRVHSAFATLGTALKAHTKAWDKIHGFNTLAISTVASRSSFRSDANSKLHLPKTNTSHNCAAFTIVRPSESIMLRVWLRYYSKHFPDHVYVFRHILNVSEAFGDSAKTDLDTTAELAASATGRVRFNELYGHPHGFAVSFLAHSAARITARFLKAGYSCVLYSDVDEFIMPEPTKYVEGLAQYVTHFMNEMPWHQVIKAVGHNMAHVSEKFDDSSTPLEAPLNWSQSLLAQRSYWTRNTKYDKPLLTKIVTKWKPGFHAAFLPLRIPTDEDLHLLHLTEVDRDFCLEREKQKFLVYDKLGHASMKGSGQNSHIGAFSRDVHNGNLCKLAKGVYDQSSGTAFDFKKTTTLEKMGPAWSTVEL